MISGNVNQSEPRISYLFITIFNYKTVIKKWLKVLYNRPQALDLLFPNGVMFWIFFSNFNTCSVEIVYEYVNILRRRIQTRRHLSGRTTKCSCFWPWQTNIKWQSHSKASTGSQFKASMAIYLIIRIIYVALVDLEKWLTSSFSKVPVFKWSTLIRYVCVSICIHFQQRFQIDAFSVNTLSAFERISVDGRPKRIEMYAFSNENT